MINTDSQIFLYIILGISISSLIWLYAKFKFTKQHLDEQINQYTAKSIEYDKLNYNHLNIIKENEANKSRIACLEILIKNTEQLKQESTSLAKSALYDLGQTLSKQLFELHVQENSTSKKNNQEIIDNATKQLNTDFEKILQSVAVLSNEVMQSKSSIDIVKQALLTPTGAGALAEITLENILKNSGLTIDRDYSLQYHIGLQEVTLRPDAVIFLPNNNLMIIDAKASKFLLEMVGESEQNNQAVDGFVKSMNIHLKQLSMKNYADHLKEHQTRKNNRTTNHIVTLMFLPSEQAIDQICKFDKNFMHKAWDLNIFPVGPSGLINMLSFAKFQISEQLRDHNWKIILEEVKKMIDSIKPLAEHSKKFSTNLHNMVNSYDKFAGSFNRNFLSRVKQLNKLGVSSNLKQTITLERFNLITSSNESTEADIEDSTQYLIENETDIAS